ncbi:unnamed protein product, partial [Didymodactylos carnosus]
MIHLITPALVCEHIAGHPLDHIPSIECLQLLEYCLQAPVERLHNVALLPLSDGSWTTFDCQSKQHTPIYYLEKGEDIVAKILVGLEKQFSKLSLSEKVNSIIGNIARAEAINKSDKNILQSIVQKDFTDVQNLSLKSCIAQAAHIIQQNDSLRELVGGLSIFRNSAKIAQFISIAESQYCMPLFPDNIPIQRPLIMCSDDDTNILMKVLSIPVYSQAKLTLEVLKYCIESNLSHHVLTVSKWIMNNWSSLQVQLPTFAEQWFRLSFIYDNGEYHTADFYYDPYDDIIKQLVEEEKYLPLLYRTEPYYSILKVQLQSKMNDDDIDNCLCKIEKLNDSKDNKISVLSS